MYVLELDLGPQAVGDSFNLEDNVVLGVAVLPRAIEDLVKEPFLLVLPTLAVRKHLYRRSRG
jgi:hypothetical protein